METPIVIYPRGLARFLIGARQRILVDPETGRLQRGSRVLEPGDLRHLEVERNFVSVGTIRSWETLDLEALRDPSGPLVRRGVLSETALRLIACLKRAILANRETAAGAPAEPEVFDFRLLVRSDRSAIVLTIVSLLVILVDLHIVTGRWVISWPGLWSFLMLLGMACATLILQRRSSGLRFDGEGITVRRVRRTLFYPWADIREFRRQHGEAELVGDGFRVPIRLEILAAGGTPLVLRRGRYGRMSLPGRLFLSWLGGQVPVHVEPPLDLTSRDRRAARWWVGIIIVLNTAIFLAEEPLTGTPQEFLERLIRMGARTEGWIAEPWRLLTSLFLHGSPSHIFFNMFTLAVLGPWMVRIFGLWRSTVIYLAGGLLGNLVGELCSQSAVAVGASTSILALLGALLGAVYRHPERVPLAARARFRWAIPMALFLTMAMGLVIPVLDNSSHLGGFIAGLLLAAGPVPPSSPTDPKPEIDPS